MARLTVGDWTLDPAASRLERQGQQIHLEPRLTDLLCHFARNPGRVIPKEELIDVVEFDLIDDMLQVTDREAFLCARELAAREAILAGGSSGAALWAVRQLTQRLGGRPARIVTLFPDSGTRYLTKIFNDGWMEARGFLDPEPETPRCRAAA